MQHKHFFFKCFSWCRFLSPLYHQLEPELCPSLMAFPRFACPYSPVVSFMVLYRVVPFLFFKETKSTLNLFIRLNGCIYFSIKPGNKYKWKLIQYCIAWHFPVRNFCKYVSVQLEFKLAKKETSTNWIFMGFCPLLNILEIKSKFQFHGWMIFYKTGKGSL